MGRRYWSTAARPALSSSGEWMWAVPHYQCMYKAEHRLVYYGSARHLNHNHHKGASKKNFNALLGRGRLTRACGCLAHSWYLDFGRKLARTQPYWRRTTFNTHTGEHWPADATQNVNVTWLRENIIHRTKVLLHGGFSKICPILRKIYSEIAKFAEIKRAE